MNSFHVKNGNTQENIAQTEYKILSSKIDEFYSQELIFLQYTALKYCLNIKEKIYRLNFCINRMNKTFNIFHSIPGVTKIIELIIF